MTGRLSLWLVFLQLVLFAVSGRSQPYHFIPNKNQWPSDVRFISMIPGGKMILHQDGFSYYFVDQPHEHFADGAPDAGDPTRGQQKREHLVRMTFEGAAQVSPVGRSPSESYYNFYLGNDPRKWAGEVYPYENVSYSSIYPGINMTLYSSDGHLKYDLIATPGADPSLIRMQYDGADVLCLENGNLFIGTSLGKVIERKPYAYQVIDGEQVTVPSEFSVTGNTVSLVFPQGYDTCASLIIDPLLIFSTFSGSTADNWGSTATPGENGTMYSAGVTTNDFTGLFPTTPGAYQSTTGGYWDIGILKYDSTGSRLLYSTYLGGANAESAHSLVVGSDRQLIVLGTTSSPDFPVTSNAYDQTFNGGESTVVIGYAYAEGSDIVLSRFTSSGARLVGSTFIGGTGNDGLNIKEGPLTRNYGDEMRGDVITDASRNIYVASITSSEDFPAMAGFMNTYNGGETDAVILKLSPDLSSITWSTFLGGMGFDAAYSLKLDESDNLFVAGGTTSQDFPVSVASYQQSLKGSADGWIARITQNGTTLERSTYTGTDSYDQVYFLDLNQAQEVYVYGQTTGNFPVTSGVYHNPNGKQFLQKFSTTLSSLRFSTVFGSGRPTPDISPTAFLVNDCNNIYMTGWGGAINNRAGYWDDFTSTSNMAISSDAFQRTTAGNDFYFIVLTDDAKNFLYGTYLGGPVSQTHVDGGTSRFDKSGVVYHAVCAGCNTDGRGAKSDFPTTPDAWSRTNRSRSNCNNAAFKFDLSSLRARMQTNSVTFDAPGLAFVCLPEPMRFQNKSIGGESFLWDFGDGTTVEKTDTNSIVHSFATPGTYTVKLKATDKGTCRVVDSTSVLVKVFQKNIDVQDDDDLCEGSSYTLKASGGFTYHWATADFSFESFDQAPLITPVDTTTYFVTVTDLNGCVVHDTVTIDVIPKIEPVFSATRKPTCFERPEVTLENLSDSLWTTDNTYFILGDGTTSESPVIEHSYESDGLYSVTMVMERMGCSYERTQAVPVFTLNIPNIITPDGDGKNDFFFIQYGKELTSPADYGYASSLLVYNRWGRVVYESGDYQNDWNASGLSNGVYYFEIRIDEHATCKSWIQVIR
jgi:gliding motility-associated-like protein